MDDAREDWKDAELIASEIAFWSVSVSDVGGRKSVLLLFESKLRRMRVDKVGRSPLLLDSGGLESPAIFPHACTIIFNNKQKEYTMGNEKIRQKRLGLTRHTYRPSRTGRKHISDQNNWA
jgi:hypothetical protein